jgi:hypothetical protein
MEKGESYNGYNDDFINKLFQMIFIHHATSMKKTAFTSTWELNGFLLTRTISLMLGGCLEAANGQIN